MLQIEPASTDYMIRRGGGDANFVPSHGNDHGPGEIYKSETVSFKTYKPTPGGLFCPEIFGSPKAYQCYCGALSGKDKVKEECPKCKTKVLKDEDRRNIMGHIKFPVPLVHTWFFKSRPSILTTITNIPAKQLDGIIYLNKYVVVNNPKQGPFSYGDIIDIDEYEDYNRDYPNVEFETGGKAIHTILSNMDINAAYKQARAEYTRDDDYLCRRGELFTNLFGPYRNGNAAHQRIMNIIMGGIPVLNPDHRPMIQQGGENWIMAEINNVYRRMLNRNARLKYYLDIRATPVIINNEIRMLQESLDNLLLVAHNGIIKTKPLIFYLTGKEGRFRKNMLGKRVDYSGRSVIAAGPDLKLRECVIPKHLAVETMTTMQKHSIMKNLNKGIRQSRDLVKARDPEMWGPLEELVKGQPVLLNRAPSLHRQSVQAFYPKLGEDNTIRIPVLACTGFNADFDGDQMAMHLPIGKEAVWEAENMMLSTKCILNSATGESILGFNQDLILGYYWMTQLKSYKDPDGLPAFLSPEAVIRKYESGLMHFRDPVRLHVKTIDGKWDTIVTSAGRCMLDQIMPNEYPNEFNWNCDFQKHAIRQPDFPIRSSYGETPRLGYIHEQFKGKGREGFKKKDINKLINSIANYYGVEAVEPIADTLVEMGFKYATKMGCTLALSDFKDFNDARKAAEKIIEESDKKANKMLKFYEHGFLTGDELTEQRVNIWDMAMKAITKELAKVLDDNPENPISVMTKSGARGSMGQLAQLVGMRGLLANSKNEILPEPIKTNFLKGLTESDYYLSAPATRKGETDKAMKTPVAGYLTRKLVNSAHDVIITMHDCEDPTLKGLEDPDITFTAGLEIDLLKTQVPSQNIVGRFLAQDVQLSAQYGNQVLGRDTLVTHYHRHAIDQYQGTTIRVRSPVTCNAAQGICQKCYGYDLGFLRLVDIGTPVGVIAAQSVGEPGLQLTLRTFHSGGAVGKDGDITGGLDLVEKMFELHKSVKPRVEEQGDAFAQAKYVIETIASEYVRSGGVFINSKHFEVILRSMMQTYEVIESHDSHWLPGMRVAKLAIYEDALRLRQMRKRVCSARPLLLGIKAAALDHTHRWLAPAAFQNTQKVLKNTAISGITDDMDDIMSRVIQGKLIPVGTCGVNATELQGRMLKDLNKEYGELSPNDQIIRKPAA